MKSFLFALILAVTPLHAADDPRLEQLREADDVRVAAIISGDREKLSAIFSDELRYGHSTGAVDNKEAYIDAVVSGRTKYLQIDYKERNFSFPAPGIALMTGRSHVQVAKDGGAVDIGLGFLAVWREEAGKWRFLSWQSCKLPDGAP